MEEVQKISHTCRFSVDCQEETGFFTTNDPSDMLVRHAP